ncbi:MAG: hypothetical protein HFJ05_04000 [Eubacterium sp.]|nr:hypothetical protein [Eubacterium sp.]
MKEKFLSLCLSFVMLLTAVTGAVPAAAVRAAQLPETIVVKGSAVEAKWLTENGTDTYGDGKEAEYLKVSSGQYANGEFMAEFAEAGIYQMSFLAAVKSAPTKFHIEVRPESDENAFKTFYDDAFFAVTDEGDSYNTYTEFGNGPSVQIPAAGSYVFKIGSWAQGADFKLAEIRFDATEIFEPYDPQRVHPVAADGETELVIGDLRNGVPKDTARDFKLNVAKAGNYTITYTLGQNSGTLASDSEDAFGVTVNPGMETEESYPAVTITKYYQELPVKQTVSLGAGEQTLRLQTLVDGFTITKVVLNPQTVHTADATQGGDVIDASAYSSASGFHAIEAGGNIGYSAEGLKVDYAVLVEKSGVYTVSYEYISQNEASLITQIDGVQVAESETAASTAPGNWYEADYADTETDGVSFRLEKGLHTVSVVWTKANINMKSLNLICMTPDMGAYVFEVEGELGPDGTGAYQVSSGKETDINGNEVGYMQVSSAQYANGRWIVNFPYAGTYKVQMVMAVPTLTNNVHMEWTPAPAQSDNDFTVLSENIPVEQTQPNEYRTFGGPELAVEEAGEYDIKFGSWVAGANWKLDKFIFTCENPVMPPSTDEPLIVEKGSTLNLREALAANKKGSLRANPSTGDYVDYVIEVKEEGDYILTYSVGANNGAVEDAFQVQVAEYKEEVSGDNFTQKLAPVQMTRYYDAIMERQAIRLRAGKFVLRTKALNSGFSLSRFTISDQIVTEIPGDGTAVTIDAVDFNDSDNYHAIQSGSAGGKGNIGYSAPGLGLDYAVQTEKSGIYNISYHYTSSGDSSLTTQRLTGDGVVSLGTSQILKATGTGNWYDADYVDSENVPVLLAGGQNTLRVRWDSADINLRSFTLAYQGSAVEYVKELLGALPSKGDLTLEDEAAVEKAKASYEALSAEEKEQIEAELVTKLNEAIAQIPVLWLAKTIADNKENLEKTFGTYNEADYRPEKWTQLVAAKNAGLDAIGKATTIAEADRELRIAKAAMAAVQKKLKSIQLTPNKSIMLAQSKAYRRNGFLNSQVKVGNYVDYFVDVKEAGEYTFTYALYADEAIEDAFAIKYDENEYPDTLAGEYAKVSVPKIEVEGNLVKEIRGTVSLKEGEQTIRFEILNDKVRLNRIKIQKKKAVEITALAEGGKFSCPADRFAEAQNQYLLENGMVTGTAAGTALDYPVSVQSEVTGFVTYMYAYEKNQAPKLVISKVDADGTVSRLAETQVSKTDGFAESEQAAVVLPAGDYTLRIAMENDGVDLRSFAVSGDRKHIPAESVRLNAHRINLQPQGSFVLTAVLTPENTTSEVVWSTDNASVAAVDEHGTITAIKDGIAVITASIDGKTAQCTVVVGKDNQKPEDPDDPKDPDGPKDPQELIPTFAAHVDAVLALTTLYVGGDTQNKTAIGIVVPTGANLASVAYTSAVPDVAEVSAAGAVTAKKAGTAVITVSVTLTNGETAKLQRQITVKKAYIKPAKANYSVKTGKTVTLKAKAYGSNKKITFKFANKKSKKFATLTKAGKLTGKAKGTVKVTAKAGKVKKTFKVKVK